MAFLPDNDSLITRPGHFPEMKYNFSNNIPSPGKIELGRLLFYDPALSKNNSISCASCHSPYNAFAHTDHNLSHGINDRTGTRNAPALFNLAWRTSFMWDGAINHLDMQALAPISNEVEMGETISDVVYKLSQSKFYRNKFIDVYGDTLITGEKILKALSVFQLTLISADSKYDKVIRGETVFTDQEKSGYELYKANCSSCHTEPLFTTNRFAANGLPVDTSLNDGGRVKITGASNDSLLFHIPSLRNLSFTYPYMHDGRFKRLYQVINHYTSGITYTQYLSPELKTPILLSDNQKADLISFLLTLNDSSFVFNTSNKFPKELLESDLKPFINNLTLVK